MNDTESFPVMKRVFANSSRKLTSLRRPALSNLKLYRAPDTAALGGQHDVPLAGDTEPSLERSKG